MNEHDKEFEERRQAMRNEIIEETKEIMQTIDSVFVLNLVLRCAKNMVKED